MPLPWGDVLGLHWCLVCGDVFEASTLMPGRFVSRTMHCNEMINVIHFTLVSILWLISVILLLYTRSVQCDTRSLFVFPPVPSSQILQHLTLQQAAVTQSTSTPAQVIDSWEHCGNSRASDKLCMSSGVIGSDWGPPVWAEFAILVLSADTHTRTCCGAEWHGSLPPWNGSRQR